MDSLVLAAGTIFAGYVVLGVAGFGSALLIVPALVWRYPLEILVPLVLMLDLLASIVHSGLNWQNVAWKELPGLLPGAALGALGAVVLAQHLPPSVLQPLLGGYLVYLCVRNLSPWVTRPRHLASAHYRLPAGLGIGVVEGAFGTAGPLVLAWLSRRVPDTLRLRATVAPTVFLVALLALLSAGLHGSIADPRLPSLVSVGVPAAVSGVFLGHAFGVRWPAARIQRVVWGLVGISGSTLLLRTLLPLSAVA